MYDLIIIGMGISGISAAIYAKRNNLNVLVLEKSAPGGLLNKINIVSNYPGVGDITGPELSYELFKQFNENKIEYKISEVLDITIENNIKKIVTKDNVYETKYVIIASGRIPRKLGLENEEKLFGRGISTCALCDGNLYKGKDIAVVGGGNSSLEETIYLAKLVNKIYLIHRKEQFTADNKLVEEVKELDNVKIIVNSKIVKINEENGMLKSIDLNNGLNLKVSGLFEYIGYIPANNYLDKLDITNEEGYIVVNDNYETKISGIYAVGDSISKKHYQLVHAASEGAEAATNIINKIKN